MTNANMIQQLTQAVKRADELLKDAIAKQDQENVLAYALQKKSLELELEKYLFTGQYQKSASKHV